MSGADLRPPRPSDEAVPPSETPGRTLRIATARARAAWRRAARALDGEEAAADRRVALAGDAALACGRAAASAARSAPADAEFAWRALLALWLDDDAAVYTGRAEHALWRLALRAGAAPFRAACEALRAATPLVFPPLEDDVLDDRRAGLAARRARLDRLYGELEAQAGRHEFAVAAGLERYRREGYAHDAVTALHRAGRNVEALALAREAAASPTTIGAEALRLLVDRLFPERGARRGQVRATEAEFAARPTREGFEAFLRAVPPDQRAAATARVLGALQRTQREPSLVFELYLEADRVLDADGMATTQRVAAETLIAGADRILARHPAMAAGWLLTAAHRLADAPEPARRAAAAPLLTRVRELAAETGRAEDFRRALARLKSRHADRPAFLRVLHRHGL